MAGLRGLNCGASVSGVGSSRAQGPRSIGAAIPCGTHNPPGWDGAPKLRLRNLRALLAGLPNVLRKLSSSRPRSPERRSFGHLR
eukprot:4162350-Alexandrium_andersonii.AAC.1